MPLKIAWGGVLRLWLGLGLEIQDGRADNLRFKIYGFESFRNFLSRPLRRRQWNECTNSSSRRYLELTWLYAHTPSSSTSGNWGLSKRL